MARVESLTNPLESPIVPQAFQMCFWVSNFEHVGHVIRQDGVSVNPKKVLTMQDWPYPKTLKRLHGILGITGYYRKFVQGYACIASTLILKKIDKLIKEK